jgi:hypothetical protein
MVTPDIGVDGKPLNSLKSWLAQSKLSRYASLPARVADTGKHVGHEIAVSTKWLVKSREHTNYTYDLSPLNVEHLAWWISAVSGAGISDSRMWIAECLDDKLMQDYIVGLTRRSSRSGLADLDVRVSRRAGWYALIRALKPSFVVETGTDKGLGSVVIQSALMRNGHGSLLTVDINPKSGYLLGGKYGLDVKAVVGDSIATLNGLDRTVDFFIHDSDHSCEHEVAEYTAIAPHLSERALVLSDNSHVTAALPLWAESRGWNFLHFQEQPVDHWYRGAGIGAAWKTRADTD